MNIRKMQRGSGMVYAILPPSDSGQGIGVSMSDHGYGDDHLSEKIKDGFEHNCACANDPLQLLPPSVPPPPPPPFPFVFVRRNK